MAKKLKLDDLFYSTIKEEIDNFTIKDDEFREELIKGGKILGINPQISRASISLNNGVNLFLSSCKNNGILFPLRDIIAYDLCTYLEHLYFSELSESVDDINKLIEDYLERNSIIRLFSANTYYNDVSGAFRSQIQSYNRVATDMYSFDINKDGHRIVEYLISNKKDTHEVIDSHKAYHERMNNIEVLERINKIK